MQRLGAHGSTEAASGYPTGRRWIPVLGARTRHPHPKRGDLYDRQAEVERERRWPSSWGDLVTDVYKVFGSRAAGVTYQPRRAAYAVIFDEGGRVAAVAHRGAYFLPGGGALPEETPEQVIEREVREELGRASNVTGWIGEALQYFYSREDDRHFAMEAAFVRATVGPQDGPGEHELSWIDPAEAERLMYHASHAWAVGAACRFEPDLRR